jgi:para-nitrobenzyl esterase
LAVYKAIPYAAPPIGKLRWTAPQPAKSWQGVLKAEDYGPWPPQPSRRDGSKPKMSEDCLYLGIATPATSVDEKLPVMVWIHGGAFVSEHYGGDLWTSLARRGVVIVSIEYRTGALGFMAHPELSKESKEGHSGNYGILDQIFALKWIQRNIAAFGGDPSKVTIFGESAGAISCSILAGSPLAKGLFRGVISQSGGFFSPWGDTRKSHMVNASQRGAERQGLEFQKYLHAKSLKELRKMDALALTGDSVGFGGFWPCVDGYVITDDQYRNYEHGNYNDVPAIIMTNSDEGAMFTMPMSVEGYHNYVQQTFDTFSDGILKLYPGNNEQETYFGFGDIFRDTGFAWPSYAWACLQSKTGKSPVYTAYLAQPSTLSCIGNKTRRGVSHADDILYINDTFLKQSTTYPIEASVAEMVQRYWINFAKTGNPNMTGLPYWPKFNKDKETTMQFSNGASLISVPNADKIELIDRYYQYLRNQTESNRRK